MATARIAIDRLENGWIISHADENPEIDDEAVKKLALANALLQGAGIMFLPRAGLRRLVCRDDEELLREVILLMATKPATMLTKLGLEPT